MSVTQTQAGIWCPVANVAEETRFGPGGASAREGTEHFSGGTKVYCFPPLWGDGYENIKVLGRHRGRHGLIELVMPFRHLTNWRAKLVFHPFVIEKMQGQWDGSDDSKRLAERIARWGQNARVCVHCLIEHRNIDLQGWWLFRAWPMLAYWDAQPGQVRLVATSRVHDEAGDYLRESRAAFDTELARLVRLLKDTLGVVVQPTPPILLGGHLQTAIVFERPSLESIPEKVPEESLSESVTRLRQLLGVSTSVD